MRSTYKYEYNEKKKQDPYFVSIRLTVSVWPPAESFSTKNQNYDHFSMTFKNHVMLTFVVENVATRET